MIVLNVTYKCRPGMRGKFLAKLISEKIDAASRVEDGNIRYDYFFPVEGNDELFLVEKWRDEAAFAAHAAAPHFNKLKELKPVYVTDTVIERFEV